MDKPTLGQIIKGRITNIPIAVIPATGKEGNFITKIRTGPDNVWSAASSEEECKRAGLTCILPQKPQLNDFLLITVIRERFVMADVIPHNGNFEKPKIGQILVGVSEKEPIVVLDTSKGNFITKLRWVGFADGWRAVSSNAELSERGLICFLNRPPKLKERICITYLHPKGNFARAVVVNPK